MANQSIRLNTLPPGRVGVQIYPLLPADTLASINEQAAPHQPESYSCFLVEQGSVEILLDQQPIYVRSPALLVLSPGQWHHLSAWHALQGWVLLADAKLVASPIRGALEQAPTGAAWVPLTSDNQAWFAPLFSGLHTAAGQQESWLVRTEVLPGLLNALLGQAAALLAHQPLPPAGRGLHLTTQFRQLVRRHFRTHKRPADYAALLHVTGSHLNDTVKAVTGFSATYFIQQEILTEARRLLCHSDLNSQEVAYQLGYDDAKYFTRLFGKSTGLTPGQFRKRK